MKKVAILQREIPHYRIRFFEEVSAKAFAMGLDVTVYSSGEEFSEYALKFAQRSLPIHQYTGSKKGPFWMKGLTAALKETDIIVAPQELQCVNVPYLWAIRHRLCTSWIWWGHGYNFQAPVHPSWSTAIKEGLKQFMTRRADGLITYTENGAIYSKKQGMPEDRVIPYYNTIDVEELRKVEAEVTDEQLKELRHSLQLERKRVLLFSGRLYAEKKVDFLLRAFAILKQSYPSVALLIIGDGEERRKLEHLTAELALQDVHFLGELIDPRATAAYFTMADLMVIPGLVGLAIVHGFAFGLPMITTQHDFHSPEIEYLTNENGVISNHNESDFGQSIASILEDKFRLENMRKAATSKADELLLSAAANSFVRAILSFSKFN